MAQHQIGSISADEIVARNRATLGSVSVSTAVYATPANYASASSIRTRLIAINGTYFTTTRMDQMSMNDLVYALRTLDDPNTI